MKTYKELNLIELRKKTGIDFAHYTYQRGQCSCCYGPRDLPKRYWKDGIIKPYNEDIQYILFKNAYNGSGTVKGNDVIKDIEFISWGLTEENLITVCEELSRRFGDEYYVIVPRNHMHTIIVLYTGCGRFYEFFVNYRKDKEKVLCNGEYID